MNIFYTFSLVHKNNIKNLFRLTYLLKENLEYLNELGVGFINAVLYIGIVWNYFKIWIYKAIYKPDRILNSDKFSGRV